MLFCIQVGDRLTLWRLRTGALARVLAVGSGLLIARHNPTFAVTFVTITLKKDCKAGWLDIRPQFQNF